jgi:hypothetical protein
MLPMFELIVQFNERGKPCPMSYEHQLVEIRLKYIQPIEAISNVPSCVGFLITGNKHREQ